MKWRNQLLALFCLLVFFAFGVFYFQYWVIQKPFGIIVFIAEGLDAQTLAEARQFAKNRDQTLALDSFPYTALLRNRSADSAVPDPAAAASALATGVKVANGAIATDAADQRLANLLELARESGRTTGLITDGEITAPSAAAFYGHAQRDEAEVDFARQLSATSALDLILGGGAADFRPAAQDGSRVDKRDLVNTIREKDFVIVQSLAELEEVPRWPRTKLFGLFSQGALPFARDAVAIENQPTLSDLVRRGIELLQFDRGGYLLVVNASLMRKARYDGRFELRMEEVLEFDRAVEVATRYAGKKSAIFVYGDVADRKSTAAPSPASAPLSPLTTALWAGSWPETFGFADLAAYPAPQCLEMNGSVASSPPDTPGLLPLIDLPTPSPSYLSEFPEDMPAFGMGLSADKLHGSRDSVAMFQIIRNNL